MTYRALWTAAATVVLALLAGPVAAATPSGTVLAVVQAANIDGATGKLVIQPDQTVYSGDRVETGPTGSAQIRFRDNTKLVVGPNSSMVIDAFVFSDSNTARQVSINVIKGAFRFMTGSSPKDAYAITTPTATIAVRGTEFDIAIEGGGTTRVANFEGETRICPRAGGGQCAEVKDPCALSLVRPQEGNVVRFGEEDTAYRNRQLKYYFPYVRNQDPLLSEFHVDLSACHFAGIPLLPSPVAPVPDEPPPAAPPPPPPPTPDPPTPPTVTPPPAPAPGGRSHDR